MDRAGGRGQVAASDSSRDSQEVRALASKDGRKALEESKRLEQRPGGMREPGVLWEQRGDQRGRGGVTRGGAGKGAEETMGHREPLGPRKGLGSLFRARWQPLQGFEQRRAPI